MADTSTTKSVNINVRVSDDLYRQLRKTMAESGYRSWAEFLEKVATGEIDLRFEFVSIDEESPEGHTAVFRLGDYTYAYRDGDFSLVRSPPRPRLTAGVGTRLRDMI